MKRKSNTLPMKSPSFLGTGKGVVAAIWAAVIVAAAALAPSAVAQTGPKVSIADAVATAQRYFTAVGIKGTATAPANTDPDKIFAYTPSGIGGDVFTGWVLTSGPYSVGVSSTTGNVVTYDCPQNETHFGFGPPKPHSFVTQAAAIKTANKMVAALGQFKQGDLTSPSADTSSGLDGSGAWQVMYHRWNATLSLAYRDEGVHVAVDGPGGAPIHLWVDDFSPQIKDQPAMVAQADAAKTALTELQKTVMNAKAMDYTFKAIVRPQQPYWTQSPDDVPPARIAWCAFYTRKGDYGDTQFEIWVDATTGQIDGEATKTIDHS